MNEDDTKIISALEEQLQESMKLKLRQRRPGKKKQEIFKPFFISYSAKDAYGIEVIAKNNSIFTKSSDDKHRSKLIKGELRIGDYAGGCGVGLFFGIAPCDTNELAIKREVWTFTNEVMWEAVKDYENKFIESIGLHQKNGKFSFFSKEKKSIYENINNGDCPLAKIDKGYWSNILKKVSKILARDDIYDSEVGLGAFYKRRYFVNSEGTKIVDDYVRYNISLNAATADKRNLLLQNNESFWGIDLNNMPSEETLFIAAENLIKDLYAMRDAKQQEAGSYPTLIDGENHGVIWHEAIGHSLEGHRLDEDSDDGMFYSGTSLTFKNKIGKKIAPDFFTVDDDPTDKNLDGHYVYDEEGVKGKKILLVKSGVLKNYLLSRESAGKLKRKSNGHARSDNINDPTPRMSNIKIYSDNEHPIEKLKEMLIYECEKQGKEYGLIFEGTMGGYTDTEESYFHTVPKRIFRLYKDGRMEQVRGIYQTATPYQMLENIIATSNDYSIFNGVCSSESGSIASTETAPDALIKSSEIGVIRKSNYGRRYKLLSKPPKE